jgi:hypothetical protein
MKLLICFTLMVCCGGAFAQRFAGVPTHSIGTFNTPSLTGGNDAFTYGRGIDLSNSKYSDVAGSPFLKQDFTNAFLAFRNGKKYSNVPVKFDILNNEIDIDEKQTLISLQEIDSISFPDSIYQIMILKTGYPSINKHDENSIYQIVAQNNKIQLLKYYHCHISTVRTLGLPDKSTFDVDDQYYLYNKATKVIVDVKLNKKSISSAIADLGYSKAEIDKDKNIDFKNEKDVATLIGTAIL